MLIRWADAAKRHPEQAMLDGWVTGKLHLKRRIGPMLGDYTPGYAEKTAVLQQPELLADLLLDTNELARYFPEPPPPDFPRSRFQDELEAGAIELRQPVTRADLEELLKSTATMPAAAEPAMPIEPGYNDQCWVDKIDALVRSGEVRSGWAAAKRIAAREEIPGSGIENSKAQRIYKKYRRTTNNY
jgi:hypothetical protein